MNKICLFLVILLSTFLGSQMICAAVAPTSISLNFEEFKMTKGEIRKLTATILPEDATDKTVTWSSDDNEVAMVDSNGVVFALDNGTTVVTASTSNNLTATCQIVVGTGVSSKVKPTGITLSPETVNMLVGETKILSATVLPENATDKSVRWTIADENVASVDNNGYLTAKAIGTTEVVAYTSNNLSAKCTVEVKATQPEQQAGWAGSYKVSSHNYTTNPTQEYPDAFEMEIEQIGGYYFITSFLGNDLKSQGIELRLDDKGDGTAYVNVKNFPWVQYSGTNKPGYAICVLDEKTDDWAETWEFKMNQSGSITIGDFYVASFTWSEATNSWTNGNLEALYYDVKANKTNPDNPSLDRYDIYLYGSMTDWEFSDNWLFRPYPDHPSVYSISCPAGQAIGTTDIFFIMTKDWSTLVYGLDPGTLFMDLDVLTKLYEGEDSMSISLYNEWNGICWLDTETGTVVFSNDSSYVPPFATSGIENIGSNAESDVEEYYDLKGQKIDKARLGKGVYIVRKGKHSKKVMVK